MSKKTITEMFETIEKNMELKKNYQEMLRSYYVEIEKIMADKLVEFGKSTGYSFTNEDLKSYMNEFLNKIASNKELSAEDLCKVSGGLGPDAAAVNAYLGQAQSQTILFANMVNQQAQYATIAAAALAQELTQLFQEE